MLAKNTQVFTGAKGYTRTRRAHVDTVGGASVKAANLLGLNVDLTRAMVLGHDSGHGPFAHQGELWMQKAMGCPDFCHEIFGVVRAQHIERKREGLNLTWQTLNGMMCHSGKMGKFAKTPEAELLNKTDKVYLLHDFNDITSPKRAAYGVAREIEDIVNVFGNTQRERTNTFLSALVIESVEMGRVSFEHSELARQFKKLRDLMYEVYVCVTQQNVESYMAPVLEFLQQIKQGDPFLLLWLMTDEDVDLIVRQKMRDAMLFNRTSVSEIAPYLRDAKIDMCNPDMDW